MINPTFPTPFIQNITQTFGKKGVTWLSHLPDVIQNACRYWNLQSLSAVENMTFHYVAKAVTASGKPVVLKIGCDEKSILSERKALQYFDGQSAIQVIDYASMYHALLLEQAIPGNSLKSLYCNEIDSTMNFYIATMKKLHHKTVTNEHEFPHISTWLNAIDTLTPNDIPPPLLQRALKLKNELLSTLGSPTVLHGDLHLDNVLCNGDSWVTIDPKGVIGEPEFEIAVFNIFRDGEFENLIAVKPVFIERTHFLAQKSHLSAQRIQDWIFVRLILIAAWNIEDNMDPSWALTLVGKIF